MAHYVIDTLARTQKAKGIAYLQAVYKHGAQVPEFQLVQHPGEIPAAWREVNPYDGIGKVFARPCPIRPRHGFVDSQVVNSVNEALAVFRAAKDADPEAEMLLMRAIKAKQSAVLTPNTMSVGLGHDGVTGEGKGVVTFPLAHVNMDWINREQASISDTPYIESVADSSHQYVVQLRDGPAVQGNACADAYIPADTTVKNIMIATGDLLSWESAVKGAPDGSVVHMPNGSMLSHYAVHAVMRGLPVIFTADAPAIGAVLKANTNAIAADYASIAQGVSHGIYCTIPNSDKARDAMAMSAFAAHQVSALTQSRDGSLAVGLAVGFMLRCGTAALLGEMRHKIPTLNEARDIVYAEALNDYTTSRGMLRTAWHVFYNGSWVAGFGGRKWASIAMATIALDGAALAYVKRPCERSFTTLVTSLHTLLNAVHNNGPWMTKFIGNEDLDAFADGRVSAVLRGGYAARAWVIEARTATVRQWALRALKAPRVPEDDKVLVARSMYGDLEVRYGEPNNMTGTKVHKLSGISYDDKAILSRIFRSSEQRYIGNQTYVALGRIEIDAMPPMVKSFILQIKGGKQS